MFTGRTIGAIGIIYHLRVVVKAENENDAINKLYDSYEHITVKYINEIEEKENNMPDITMCSGFRIINEKKTMCDKRHDCYRYKATPSDMQSWFMYSPFELKENKCYCDYYLQMRKS